MESEIIEPFEYVTTSLWDKLYLAIEFLKKNKRTKLKNYLEQRHSLILKGVENFLDNYSVFLRVHEKFQKFRNGEHETEQ